MVYLRCPVSCKLQLKDENFASPTSVLSELCIYVHHTLYQLANIVLDICVGTPVVIVYNCIFLFQLTYQGILQSKSA
jgi:hypothetical protein